MNKVFINILLFLFTVSIFGQSTEKERDSLIKAYKINAWDFRHINPQKASKYLQDGLALSYEKENDIDIGYFYRKLVSQKGYQDKLDSARHYFKKGNSYFENLSENEIVDKALPAHLHSELAEAYHVNDVMDSAFYHYKKAGERYKVANDSLGVMISYANLGNIYNNRSNYQKAIDLYLQAAEMADTTQFLYIKGEIFGNISVIYNTMNKPRMGKKYAYKYLNTVLKDKEHEYWIKSYISVAYEEIKDEKFHLAESHLKNAEKLIDSFGYKSYYLQLNKHKAEILLKQNKPEQAKELLQQTEPLLQEFKYTPELSFSYKYKLAKSHFLTGETQKAKNILLPLEKLSDSLKLKKEQAYINNYLNEIFLEESNYRKAYAYKSKYHQINDSILSVDAQKQFQEIETKYETEKKELALAKSKTQLAEKELEVRNKNLMLYGGAVMIFTLLIYGILLHNQQKLKNRQLQKEAELNTALAKIETQNKLEEQRLRISRDLHDNIGSQLTFIISSLGNLPFSYPKMQEELSEKIGVISEFTRQTIFELRDTIWAMNKSEITMADLEQRLQNLTLNARKLNPSIDFEFTSKVSDSFSFNSIQGINFYRIIQEAVNNAIKHSKATKIDILITEENKFLKTSIYDNGIGFNVTENKDSNGLNNMEKRAADLEGEIQFQSKPNKGTSVIFTVKKPLNTSFAV